MVNGEMQEFLEEIGEQGSELAAVGSAMHEITMDGADGKRAEALLKEIDKIVGGEEDPFRRDAMIMDKIQALIHLERFEEALSAAQHISQLDVRSSYYADIGISLKERGKDAGKIGFLIHSLPFQTDDEEVEQAIGESLLRFEKGQRE